MANVDLDTPPNTDTHIHNTPLHFTHTQTYVSVLSASRTDCTGRYPLCGCLLKYCFDRNLFFSVLAKSLILSPDVVWYPWSGSGLGEVQDTGGWWMMGRWGKKKLNESETES